MISTVAFFSPVTGLVVGVLGLSDPPEMSFSSSISPVVDGSLLLMGSSSCSTTLLPLLLAVLFEFFDNSPMTTKIPHIINPTSTTGIIILIRLNFFLVFCFFIEVKPPYLVIVAQIGLRGKGCVDICGRVIIIAMKSKAKIKKRRVSVFVDASNVWEAQKTRGRFLDFEKLANFLKRFYETDSFRFYYYTAYPEEGTRAYSTATKHRFFTYLNKGLGFVVRKKPLKRIRTSDGLVEGIYEKGNMDVEMAIDVVSAIGSYDIALFFSGDSDFLALIRFIRSRNKKVFVYSSKNNVSREMRTGADGYVDLLDIEEDIWGNELRKREIKP